VSRWLIALLALALLFALAQPEDRVAYGADPTEVQAVTSELVCPCNTNLSVAACQESIECPLAAKMESLADELVTSGMSRDEALDYFVEVYSDSILVSPRKEGFALSAWVVPFIAVGLGMAAISWLSWKWTRQRRDAVPATSQGDTGEPGLAAYRKRVERDLEQLG
jgi:cytochrome c-type biogenesis protein CcmH/NrfF